jgi:hypothetical protein
MRPCAASVRLIVSVSLACACFAASAQSATLCSSDGRSYPSDQPCAVRPSTSLRSVGPEREARRSSSSYESASVYKAGEHLQYQSPRCSEMSEGIRNGPARGLGRAAQQELQESYRRLCSDDESNARKRLSEEKGRQRESREREDKTAKAEQDRQKLGREQCDEMYRIVSGKRKRVESMTSGERGDFERFEATWKERCRV